MLARDSKRIEDGDTTGPDQGGGRDSLWMPAAGRGDLAKGHLGAVT